jgi:hypothetical protein
MTPRFHGIDDARRKLGFIAIQVFIAPTAFGQLAQPRPDREKASLAQFHNEHRKYAHLHDTYLGVAPIGMKRRCLCFSNDCDRISGPPNPAIRQGLEWHSTAPRSI